MSRYFLLTSWMVVAAILGLGNLGGGTAEATTFTVTSLADDGSPGTLRYLLKFVNDGDTIVIPSVSSAPTPPIYLSLGGSTALDVDGNVDLDVTKSITIQGAGAGVTMINGAPGGRVFDVDPDHSSLHVMLVGMTIRYGNTGSSGGGILNEGPGSLTVSDCALMDNVASRGGGISMSDGSLLLRNTAVAANMAHGDGGGIYGAGDDILIVNSAIYDNEALNDGNGGGIVANGTSSRLINATIMNNRAERSGGGIWNEKHMDLNHVTITANVSDADASGASGGDGGGLFNEGPLYFKNSILAGNSDASAGQEAPDCFAVSSYALAATGPNIIETPSGCDISSGAAGILNVDPLFGPAGVGGSTATLSLQAGSPAIDAGVGSVPVDQRGFGRPVDGNGDGTALPDLGAYEVSAAPASFPEAVCGNGTVEWPELCDDGNAADGDGCSAICLVETAGGGGSTTGGGTGTLPGGTFKFRVKDLGPVPAKNLATTVFAGRCGDGVLQTARGEQCDDGNTLNGDACSANCTKPPMKKEPPEKPWYRRLQFWR